MLLFGYIIIIDAFPEIPERLRVRGGEFASLSFLMLSLLRVLHTFIVFTL